MFLLTLTAGCLRASMFFVSTGASMGLTLDVNKLQETNDTIYDVTERTQLAFVIGHSWCHLCRRMPT